jgi:acyl carrier protein
MQAVRRLHELPTIERYDELETMVVTEFKGALFMTDDEEFPLDGSYFDLGLTSVALTELKERLEQLLDMAIDATVLFNEPTVERLVTYLIDELFRGGEVR